MSINPVPEPKFHGLRRVRVDEPGTPKWLVTLIRWTGRALILKMVFAVLAFIYIKTGSAASTLFVVFAGLLVYLVAGEIRGRARRAYVA